MKEIELNTSKDLSALKESFNKMIDKKIEKKKLSEKINSMGGLSFCDSNVIFESLLDKLYDNANGKKIIASYIKLIKENKSLSNVYKILESVKNGSINPNTSATIISNICHNIDKNSLCEGEKKMSKLLEKAISISDINMEKIDFVLSENKTINECVDYLCKNKETVKNLTERVNKIDTLSKIISESKKSDISENKVDNKSLLANLNNLMDNDLELWENKVIKDIIICNMSNGDKSQLFEQYKNECISEIDRILSESDVENSSRLFSMKQQLSEKLYSEDTISNDLFTLANLKETLTNE